MTVGDWEDLAITLAVALNRSIDRHYAGYATAPVVSVAGPDTPDMQAAARALLA